MTESAGDDYSYINLCYGAYESDNITHFRLEYYSGGWAEIGSNFIPDVGTASGGRRLYAIYLAYNGSDPFPDGTYTLRAKALNSYDESVYSIAFAVGFESLRTFNRVFYRIMGCSPGEYREKQKS